VNGAVLLLVFACPACMASYLRGRVTDCRDSAALDGADVQLTAKAAGAAWTAQETGNDGAYAFKVEDKSFVPVTLVVAKAGYRSAEKAYDSIPSGTQEVCLRPTKR
jgi:hypothetical protein